MERGANSNPTGHIDKSRVLDVKPLRSLKPIFSPQMGSPQSAPFSGVPPTGPFAPGGAPFHHFAFGNNSQRASDFANAIPSPVPLNSFRTPDTQYANGDTGPSKTRGRPRRGRTAQDDYGNSDQGEEDPSSGRRPRGTQKRGKGPANFSSLQVSIDDTLDQFLRAFKLTGLESHQQADGNKELVKRVLLTYNLFRRRLFQICEAKEDIPGGTSRPDLKAATTLMTKGARTNSTKRVGTVPGVEVGDIFFFRMEMCMVGMHAPTMAGIDYMTVKLSADDEPVAVSVVSSGGYEDDGEDGDVLIYSGQGGVQRKDGQIFDQKLERGNLALEKSLHRANVVRVIRGVKDVPNGTGKIYIYDGLYKVHESWVDKGKGGYNVFKYKFVRVPGQPQAFTLWKSIDQWKSGTGTRIGVILPDLTSGIETIPVSLVNDVDDEKGPAYFTYSSTLRYDKPFDLPVPSSGCACHGGCQAGDANCPCVQRNGGFLPYNLLGVVLNYKALIHECGPSCLCPPNCRNRVSQAGLKVRLEVFRTKDKGWGLRSWDPIRSGMFICQYAGDVIDASRTMELGSEHEEYIFDTTRAYPPLDYTSDGSAEVPFSLIISAKNSGNVARFMNHSCSPNIFWQPVLRDDGDKTYLHVGFYSIGHIPPMQELTFDYGIPKSDNAALRRKRCLCGSLNCKGYFY
ncbi:Histone-lysine N-methyltransferase, H3 lysine-9 specific SUVH1 [Heracleum sosnowskyi]|uniref:Histone-lysine N-methyltransferase, H3 lysine-9 specific SUVH1 n=1 Tax=Heracleum sosnowskyi TaxID=360622 RepID=A0AAD8ILB2_9APIA|nr:Histone-lysine N-methyltransferase, H3 lysine-9 specific SUVH1 [Heracleum sosnowskyi]